MLQVNKSLTCLNLSSKCTMADEQKFSHIFHGLENNTTLSHLVLRGRKITYQDALHRCIAQNNIPRCIAQNNIPRCIAQVLVSNQCFLQTVDLSHSDASKRSFLLILDSLKFNSTVKKLLLISNNREMYFEPGVLSVLDLAVKEEN